MTRSLLGLPMDSLSADKIRATPDNLRQCLAEIARRGDDVWTGPIPDLIDVLVDVARVDLCLARLVEGHSDGLRILQQADRKRGPGLYGVWASRSVGTGVRACKLDEAWHLKGELRFASGVDLIDRALVPGWVDEDHHALLDVPADCGAPDRESWRTHGMDASRTYTIHVDARLPDAHQVGPPDFYLQRPGFVVGGLCVAAVWAGGAHQVLDVVATSLRHHRIDPHQLRRLGLIEQAVWESANLLRTTLAAIEDLHHDALAREIAMARTSVVKACETVIAEASRVVGPAGLSRNPRLSRVIEDLAIYIRQHHLDIALTSLGQHAVDSHEPLAE